MVRVYLYTEATVGNVADRGGMERFINLLILNKFIDRS
jgi:hypothetical protein